MANSIIKSVMDFPRGSEWRQWDLHIHTPASFHWCDGKRFKKMNIDEKKKAIDKMIEAMNNASPAVFAIMDYWTFDGWLALQERLSDQDAPILKKKVFPGIELRLISPTKFRLNAHVLLSDQTTNQELNDFKSKLIVAIIEQPLSDECLVKLARMITEDKLKKSECTKEQTVDEDDALIVGSKIAEITVESYIQAFESVPNGKALGFMPWSTSDGMNSLRWDEHYAYSTKLLNALKIFETRNYDEWAAFVNIETDGNRKFFKNFQTALRGTPRLPVSGSDAHRFIAKGQERGYGDFPSEKITWIKADPTFQGLLQALKEPANRSYIGKIPPKLADIETNKNFFIDKVSIRKTGLASFKEKWFDGCDILLNPDLVAIIGNKGSGKSALTDVIALLGHSKQKSYFSFLSSTRFCSKPREFAKGFTGNIVWRTNANNHSIILSNNPEVTSTELVKYIPQAHFEKLCNAHASGESDIFEKELRSVIFSHTSQAIRQKASDFNQLIEQQEASLRDQINEYRKELTKINQDIEYYESELQPDIINTFRKQREAREKQINEHHQIKPIEKFKPSDLLSDEQKAALMAVTNINNEVTLLEAEIKTLTDQENLIVRNINSITNILDRINIIKRQYNQFENDTVSDFKNLDINISDIISFSIDTDIISKKKEYLQKNKEENTKNISELRLKKDNKIKEKNSLEEQLDESNKIYQQYLKDIESWNTKLKELIGSVNEPNSLEGIKKRIEELLSTPKILEEKYKDRIEISSKIYDVLFAQRKAREALFKPVQDLITENSLIRDGYKLQFQAYLIGSPYSLATKLFVMIKQTTGEFRGEEESHATIQKISEKYDFNDKDQTLKFIQELMLKIREVSKEGQKGFGIKSTLRNGQTSVDVYDLIFGLNFLEPRYSILFQDAPIDYLSPGQRGALLLIFYLLVDKGRSPIILDQPEENLDNETVVSLLVPVLNAAKKNRQIIMVTHNPNLAVVCDAEQIIYSSFDRKDDAKIQYISGSIENEMINRYVVDVLEGTKLAFDNRRSKYQ